MKNKEKRSETLARGEPTRSSRDETGRGWGEGEAEDEREIRELEAEVEEMAQRIQQFRRTVPARLAEALSAQVVAQRPRLPLEVDAGLQVRASQVGIGGPQDEGASEYPDLNNRASLPEADQEMHERLHILRAKISSNIESMPNILKRINGCIARIKKVGRYSIEVHSAFKRRRKI